MVVMPPNGIAYTAKNPRVEIWSNLTLAANGAPLTPTSTLTQEASCIGGQCGGSQPIIKKTIEATAADLNGDNIDEIAMSRCTWTVEPGEGADPRVPCHGGTLNGFTDAEIAVMHPNLAHGAARFEQIGQVKTRGDDSGFREVRFADINGDGNLDLVFAVEDRIGVSCGSTGGTGFGSEASTGRSNATTYTHAFSPGPGHFIQGRGMDSVITGAFLDQGKTSGFNLALADRCSFPAQVPAVVVDERSFSARALIARVADLNHDGWDDVLILQRETGHLIVYFGTGTEGFARGPEIDIPTRGDGELGLFIESDGANKTAVAATTDPARERVYVYRLSAR
jgi:hypothetical protein